MPILDTLQQFKSTIQPDIRRQLAETIYLHIQDVLHAYVRSKIVSPAADDIHQEVARGIVKGLQKCRAETEDDFRIWYFRIAKNKLNDHLRKKYRDRVEALAPDDILQAVDSSGLYNESDAYGIRLDLEKILQLLEMIKPGCRYLLWHHRGIGMDYPELGKEFGLSKDAVRVKIERCLVAAQKIARRLN